MVTIDSHKTTPPIFRRLLTDYALSQGWIRVADYDIEAQRLDSRTLSNIARGLSEHYGGSIPTHLSFNLESKATGRFYSNVPVDVIEGANSGELLSYRMGSGYNYGYMTKAGQAGYLSKISQRGEFWLADGVATYADGDIGDYNHEGVVIDTILANHNMDFETFEELASRANKDATAFAGFTEDEIAAVRGTKDARDYALKYLGWVRVNGNSVQTWAISREILNDIANGLWDAYDEECGDYTYTIEVSSRGELFTGVPFSVIASGDPAGLMRYKER